ncbi:MAG: DEAD/DEAH box helicase [Methanomassiliicoccales archaeon]
MTQAPHDLSPVMRRNRLPRTWGIFYGRYGKMLPVQEMALSVIMAHKNAMVIAPTATGKTEAVMAPLSELMLDEKWAGLSVVYIAPTRALVNDVRFRLKDQLEQVGIVLEIKTGDNPSLDYDKPPDILVTTPESLDSILCRHPDALRGLRSLILDEIHLIDNTYRGDQLRLLIRRLRAMKEMSFSTYCLSATVVDPAEVGLRYLPPDFEVVQVAGGREINCTYVDSLDSAFAQIDSERLKKALIFCNSRKGTEHVGSLCRDRWDPNSVVVHHGSLSKQTREEGEGFMKGSPWCICVATMTLEIGIDIGDIDVVVLADIPHSVSSMLQRIGRSNRRQSVNRVIAVYETDDELDTLMEMMERAKVGVLEPRTYHADESVAVQQIFSLLYSRPSGMSIDDLSSLMEGFISYSDLDSIIQSLHDHELIEIRNGRIQASTSLMDFGERGKVHSNIPDPFSVQVVEEKSNTPIGEIYLPVDEVFTLGGRTWKMSRLENGKLYVRACNLKAGNVRFRPLVNYGAFFKYLPDEMRSRMKDRAKTFQS